MCLASFGLSEADILTWANQRVHAAGSSLRLSGFGDPAVRSGVYVLALLQAVAPECVSSTDILAGLTSDECRLNAMLAISTTHKLGGAIFATWEDVTEARPRMMLCLFAAVMAEDLRRGNARGDLTLAGSTYVGVIE